MSNHLFSSIKEEKGEVLHCKNINSPLTKLMGYTEECIEEIDWKPPIKHGLNNSKKIIPTLYFKNTIVPFKLVLLINGETLLRVLISFAEN